MPVLSPVPGGRGPGFSLIEVVISLGIVSFALLSLLGLMAVSVNDGKSSQDDMVIASLAKSVFASTRTNSFANLSTLSETHYYDFTGLETNRPAAYYSCVVSNSLIPLPFAGTTNMASVRLSFSWPVAAAKPNAQIFQTVVAPY